jgi:hypothetical protein
MPACAQRRRAETARRSTGGTSATTSLCCTTRRWLHGAAACERAQGQAVPSSADAAARWLNSHRQRLLRSIRAPAVARLKLLVSCLP